MSVIFSRESKSITLEVYLFPAICSFLINRLSAIIDSLTLSLSLCSLFLLIYSGFSFSFLGSTFNLSFHGPIDAIRIHSGPLLNEKSLRPSRILRVLAADPFHIEYTKGSGGAARQS